MTSNSIFTLIAIITCVVYFFSLEQQAGEEKVHQTGSNDPTRVIMYSLTTCGYCKEKVKLLRRDNIAFTEYFIDRDANRADELNRKLAKAGFAPRSYGTPIMDIYGVMLPNNPDMKTIHRHLSTQRHREEGSDGLSEFSG